MNAYLIDPFTKTCTEVVIDAPGDLGMLHAIYRLLGCETIEAIYPVNSGTDMIYVDEDGLYRGEQAFFLCRLWPRSPLAGKGLWIGTTPGGGNKSPEMPFDYVSSHIVFEPRHE